jgi:micrococcal nuclease
MGATVLDQAHRRHRARHDPARRHRVRRRSGPAVAAPAVAALAVAVLLSGCRDPAAHDTSIAPPSTVLAANAVVTGHVDGDTLDVRVVTAGIEREERVRLIGIDTPETMHPTRPVECFGPEASAHLAELLPLGTPVRLERDLVGRDDYGRLLAYVHRATDGRFVNEALVADGYARPFPYEPNTAYAGVFVAAATGAEAAGLGLWSACRGTGDG